MIPVKSRWVRDTPIFYPRVYAGESGYDDFYPDIDRERIEYEGRLGNLYYGRKVCWIGHKGRMMEVDADYIYPIQGNQFYGDKLDSLTNKILSEGDVYLYAPYGIMSIIDIDTVRESLEYADSGYEHDPLTTGDIELDYYLVNGDSYDQDERLSLDQSIAEAIENCAGDLGKQIVQVRDGNHRAFAAAAAGEPSIWIRMYENQFHDVQRERPAISKYKKYLF